MFKPGKDACSDLCGRLANIPFPILDKTLMHAKQPGEVRLHEMNVEPALFDVFANVFRVSRNDLRAFPPVRVGATHGLDALITKRQCTPRGFSGQLHTIRPLQKMV
jgi:hypothetical protein